MYVLFSSQLYVADGLLSIFCQRSGPDISEYLAVNIWLFSDFATVSDTSDDDGQISER